MSSGTETSPEPSVSKAPHRALRRTSPSSWQLWQILSNSPRETCAPYLPNATISRRVKCVLESSSSTSADESPAMLTEGAGRGDAFGKARQGKAR